MTVKEFIPKAYSKTIEKGSVTWSSPSNIALVKYWGKKEHQIPANPSISFTLDNCRTTTTLKIEKKISNTEFSFDVFLEEEKKDDDLRLGKMLPPGSGNPEQQQQQQQQQCQRW